MTAVRTVIVLAAGCGQDLVREETCFGAPPPQDVSSTKGRTDLVNTELTLEVRRQLFEYIAELWECPTACTSTVSISTRHSRGRSQALGAPREVRPGSPLVAETPSAHESCRHER